MFDGRKRITVALAGNPNAGKTTMFNALTGARQHVGNYPGVTVEKKEGSATVGDVELTIVDLPGTYSLTAYSQEEIVARSVLLNERPDAVIDIVDCSNLERNLYLTTQLLELGVPVVLAFNMSDVAKARGYSIDVWKLSALLGVPIVETVASKGRGVQELLAAAVMVAGEGREAIARQRQPDYGTEIEPHVRQLQAAVEKMPQFQEHSRWHAIKLLENDCETVTQLGAMAEQEIARCHPQAERSGAWGCGGGSEHPQAEKNPLEGGTQRNVAAGTPAQAPGRPGLWGLSVPCCPCPARG
jgi:ferrous iron transport protein B